MKEETGYFSSFDGTQLFYRAWEQDSPSVLIVVHGIGEHSGRYHELVEVLSTLPLSIFALDLRGHGHSEGEKVYVNSFQDFVDDIYHFRTFILDKKVGKTRHFILLGQSMGGLIGTHAVLHNQRDWNALILLSPFFAIPFGHYLSRAVATVLDWLDPMRIWNNPIKPAFLTHDLERVELYKRDPLIQRRITARLAREMFRAVSQAMARANEVTLPLLILAAGSDYIVSTRKTRQFFDRVSSKEKKIQIFNGCYHELLHEVNREQPINILKDYLWAVGR